MFAPPPKHSPPSLLKFKASGYIFGELTTELASRSMIATAVRLNSV